MTKTEEILRLEVAVLTEKILHMEDQLNTYRYDALTGLKLRKDFNDRFNQYFNENAFYLTIVDINGLHNMNRDLGYLAGDDLIKRVSRYLIDKCEGCIFRIGGDEFAILSIHKPECDENNDFVYNTVHNKDYKTTREMFTECDKGLKPQKDAFYEITGLERRGDERRVKEC